MVQAGEEGIRPVVLSQEAPFRLGALAVEPATRRVFHEGRSEVVEPRVMQVLVALARQPGAILGRDELIARCWGGRIVGDNAIHRVMSRLRELGADFAGGAFRVQTIARVGYRLLTTEPADAAAAAHEITATETPPAPNLVARTTRRRMLGIGAGAALAGGGAVAYLASRTNGTERRVQALLAQSEQAARSGLPDSDAQGVGFLEEAVRLAPENAEAWGKLALARRTFAEYAPPDRVTAAATAAQDAARRALALNPRQADALSALAILPPEFGDWTAAERRMRSVLAVAPRHLPTLDAYAFFLPSVGRVREGALLRLQFAGREPLHAIHQYRLVYAHWMLGDVGATDRAAERALHLWPKHPAMWFARLWTLAFTGRADRALDHVLDTQARPLLAPPLVQALAAAAAAMTSRRSGDVSEATDRIMGLVAKGPSHCVNAILLLTGLGQIDRAYQVAEAYLLERGPVRAAVRWREGQLSVNDQRRRKTNMLFVPATASLRADRRFPALMEDVGLAGYWREVAIAPDHAKTAA